jgi:hypothetical protein
MIHVFYNLAISSQILDRPSHLVTWINKSNLEGNVVLQTHSTFPFSFDDGLDCIPTQLSADTMSFPRLSLHSSERLCLLSWFIEEQKTLHPLQKYGFSSPKCGRRCRKYAPSSGKALHKNDTDKP